MLDELLDVMDECSSEEVPNHAFVGDEYIAIMDCEEPLIARNNCHAVTMHLGEELHSEFQDLMVIRVDFDNSTVHYALEYRGTVIDYTMRQFHEDTPFPYVEPTETWIEQVKSGALKTHGGQIHAIQIGMDVSVTC